MKQFIIILAIAITVTGSDVFAAVYDYECYSYYWNGRNEKGTMSLRVSKTIASADIHQKSWDKDLGGKINKNYKSKGSIKFLKYGYNLILEEALVEGGKALKDGSLGGIARVEGEAEGGFFQYKFICKR
jgi:hypothetical protein